MEKLLEWEDLGFFKGKKLTKIEDFGPKFLPKIPRAPGFFSTPGMRKFQRDFFPPLFPVFWVLPGDFWG